MNRNDAESLAGEYVLGTLSGPELAEFEANLARDPRVAASGGRPGSGG
ncbi:MAG: hypothetical protein V9H25_21710 [Candidatus Competibacter sp.]